MKTWHFFGLREWTMTTTRRTIVVSDIHFLNGNETEMRKRNFYIWFIEEFLIIFHQLVMRRRNTEEKAKKSNTYHPDPPLLHSSGAPQPIRISQVVSQRMNENKKQELNKKKRRKNLYKKRNHLPQLAENWYLPAAIAILSNCCKNDEKQKRWRELKNEKLRDDEAMKENKTRKNSILMLLCTRTYNSSHIIIPMWYDRT